MLRLSPPQGVPLDRASILDLHVAGSEANVAVALASLGRSVAWVSKLPENPLGRRVSRELTAAGVDLSLVEWDRDGRLGIYFVDHGRGPAGVSVTYDRGGSSIGTLMPDAVPSRQIAQSRVVHLTGITPALSEECRRTTLAVAQSARELDCMLSVDVNYRAKLWSIADARRSLEELVAGVDLLICSQEDASHVFGIEGSVDASASVLADRFEVQHVVVTAGESGALLLSNREFTFVSAIPTTIVDRPGAGDALAAGVIDGLLDGDVVDGLRRGTAMAATALATRGDIITIGRAELNAILGSSGRSVDR